MAVDAQDAHGVLTSDRINETDILDGRWDGARVEIWRVNWAETNQRLLLRRGALGEVRRGQTRFVAEVRSLAHMLSQPIGRSFGKACDATLGDARCGVDLDDPKYSAAGTVGAVLRDRAFVTTSLDIYAADLFTLGRLSWETGSNEGRAAKVGWHALDGATATLTLDAAPLFPILPGDSFTIRAGCDKRIETCVAVFDNAINHRGFPNIPGNDSVLRYAGNEGGHAGEVL